MKKTLDHWYIGEYAVFYFQRLYLEQAIWFCSSVLQTQSLSPLSIKACDVICEQPIFKTCFWLFFAKMPDAFSSRCNNTNDVLLDTQTKHLLLQSKSFAFHIRVEEDTRKRESCLLSSNVKSIQKHTTTTTKPFLNNKFLIRFREEKKV